MVWRKYCWFLLSVLAVYALAEEEAAVVANEKLVAALKAYEGRWAGHFTVHSTATGYTESFPVEQQYWWKDGQLHGVAVTHRESGMTSARSQTVVDDGKLITRVKQGDSAETYWGLLRDGGVVWFPTNVKRLTDYQMTERMIEIEGERVLKTEGFDTYVYGEGIAHLMYRGELKFVER
jgi:hypothetical protein